MLKADNLSKRYGRRTVLNRVTVSIAPGEFVAIMGPSGSGKSTLARTLLRLEQADSGEALWKGRDLIRMNARDLLGGNGILIQNEVARHFADIEAIHTYEGTETVQGLIIGREITGVGAFV